jgi:putative transposase
LCAVKDAYSARIVGYSISSRMKARLAVDALEMAVRPVAAAMWPDA